MKWNLVAAAVACWGLQTLPAFADTDWNLALEAERIHQSFGDGDADIDTVTLSPSLHVGNWSLVATIPWQHIDGSYFVNNAYPNLEYICSAINGLTPAQKLLLIYRGSLTTDQVQYCSNTGGIESLTLEDSVEGFNDIELFANYYLPVFNDQITGTAGIGYKHDNGDVDLGLGTGTRDLLVETSWLFDVAPVSMLLTLGYEHILQDNTAIDVDINDYAYASLDGRWQLLDLAAIGVEYHYQQASADVLDDLDYLVYYLNLGRGSGWGARLFMTDYQNAKGYPDDEIGGSLSYTF